MSVFGAAASDQDRPGGATAYSADWSPFARRVTALLLLVAFVVAATLVTPILTATILAAILAFLLSYPTRELTRRTRLGFIGAAALVAVAYLLFGAFVLFAVIIPALGFFDDLVVQAATTLQDFGAFLATYTPEQGWLVNPETGERIVNLNFLLQPLSDLVQGGDLSQLRDLTSQVLTVVGGAAMTLSSLIGILLVASVLGIAFLLQASGAIRSALRALRPDHRREAAILIAFVETIWSDYFRATLVCGALMGALTAVQLLIMGITGALLIGAFTAIVSIVPIIGGFVALIPIGLAPLALGSTVLQVDRLTLVLLVVGINLFLQLIMWNALQPLIIGNAVTLSVTVIMLVVAIGTALGGMLGAFIAVPVAAVAREVAVYLLRKIRGGDPYPGISEPAFAARWLEPPTGPADEDRP